MKSILILFYAFTLGLMAQESSRPNIIFLLTDDQRADALACYGGKVAKTPHLDNLAKNGVLFEKAFVTDPICKPSRVSFLTGQYERTHRVGFSSYEPLSEKQWETCYPALMRKAGYHTGFIGKFGVEKYDFKGEADKKFDFWYASDGWGNFWPKRWPKKSLEIYNDSPAKIVTEIMTYGAEKFFAQRDKSKPFCLSVSYMAPHGSVSSTMHGKEAGGINRMRTPANQFEELKGHPIYGELYRDYPFTLPKTYTKNPSDYLPLEIHDPYNKKDEKRSRFQTYSYNFEEKKILEHQARYAQLSHGLDQSVGKIIKMLKAEGLDKNTIIVYTSDHGLLMGDYGLGGKGLLYDLATQVPLIVYDPRLPQEQRGRRISEQIRSIDVTPTLIKMAQLEIPELMDGRDISPLIYSNDKSTTWPQEIFLESLYLGRDGAYQEAIRSKKWKYIRYYRKEQFKNFKDHYKKCPDFANEAPLFEQVFDLEKDPGEMKNLATLSEHQAVLEELRKKCQAHSNQLVQNSYKTNPYEKKK